jgi:N-acetylneuraminate synthase
MSVFIIAEAGVNHNGNIKIAKELVDAAVEAGANAIKFQTFRAEEIATKGSPKADYQLKNTGQDESQFEMLKKLQLSESAHRELFTYCRQKDIMFMSTPFDRASADLLDSMGMTIFKIPSGEITNKSLIEHIASKRKPVVLSTGMSYLGEVEKAIGWINGVWAKFNEKQQLTLLHCVSNYPADVADVNLLAIKTMKEAFGLPVGYSDHTMGIEASVAAVAIGASVIEKHFTLDRTMEGPDHRASLEPQELRKMVRAIRNIEQAMGDGVKRPAASEESVRMVARRSLVAAKTINAGTTITPDDIAVKRPGTGISPEFSEVVINMKASRKIEKDSIITWEDLKDA